FVTLCAALVLPVTFVLLLRPPTSTLFPYTTLFRSHPRRCGFQDQPLQSVHCRDLGRVRADPARRTRVLSQPAQGPAAATGIRHRSEEHTSELQSHLNLVCRLLLEKKKKSILENDIS